MKKEDDYLRRGPLTLKSGTWRAALDNVQQAYTERNFPILGHIGNEFRLLDNLIDVHPGDACAMTFGDPNFKKETNLVEQLAGPNGVFVAHMLIEKRDSK